MTLISPTEAGARFSGVLALTAIGFLFLLNFSRVAGEGAWAMAIIFAVLIAASILVSFALVRSDSHIVRTPWLHAIGIAAMMLAIHFLSRTSGMPGMDELKGSFFSFFGMLEVLAGFGLISTAAYAMRELTLEGIPHHRPPGSVQVPRGTAAGYYSLVVALVLILPSVASAAEKTGKAAGKADSSGTEAALAPTGSSGTDALLGATEISIAFVLSLAFVAWAGNTLRERSAPTAAAWN